MTITTTQKLRLFSHTAGARCLLPGTAYTVRAFPARIEIQDLEGHILKVHPLPAQGPVSGFTLLQDLERGVVHVFSTQYAFYILPDLQIVASKHPGISQRREQETLVFGCHKQPLWERVRERGDFREIFPLWFRLGNLLSLPPRHAGGGGISQLLEACHSAITLHRPEKILREFEKLFRVGFGEMLVPRLQDTDYQGILPEDLPLEDFSPLYLLTEGAALIRSCFFVSSGEEGTILPHLPPPLSEGRALSFCWPGVGKLSFVWSKKQIRMVWLQAEHTGRLHLHFPSEMRSYRFRTSQEGHGKRYSVGEPVEIKSGAHYLWDQFQK